MNNDVKELTQKLEDGVKDIFESGKYQNYLDVMGKFYNYSVNNCILIVAQKPEATHVASFKKWHTDFNRYVKKGEKAIKILAPIECKRAKQTVKEDGTIEEETVKFISYKAVPVFDLSQTEGEELPELLHKLSGNLEDYEGTLKTIEGLSPVPISFEENTGRANGYYTHTENRIVINSSLSQEQTIKTLVHEISHSILHSKEGEEKDADKRTKEVQAESIAYIVCSYMGLDTSDYSFGYIASWSNGKDLKELGESMEVIKKTAGKLIDGLKSAA